MSSYKETLQYLYGLERFGIRMGLERINALLKLLDNPQKRFSVIHVGGTNGKGSTSAMLASILKEAGYRVGLYTSPHLVKFNERIRVDGEEIPDKKIVELVEKVKKRSQKSEVRSQKYTFFEFTTAMAFLYFAEEKVDIAVIEVGLGGRLDATNICKPLMSIITNVTREHEDILGKGIKKIANEKAGIIKKNGILITSAQQPSVLKIFGRICRLRSAEFYRLGKDFRISRLTTHDSRFFDFYGKKWHFNKLKTNLLGRHQYINAGLAIFALEIIDGNGFKIEESAVRRGLDNVKCIGRFQIISREPTIVLDCAHNPAGAKVLRDALLDLRFAIDDLRMKNKNNNSKIENRKSKMILVIGIMADKDIEGFLSSIAPIADLIILTAPDIPRAAEKEMLFPIAKSFTKNVKFVEDVKNAYRFARSIAKKDDLVCVTGSFYTVGEALSHCKLKIEN